MLEVEVSSDEEEEDNDAAADIIHIESKYFLIRVIFIFLNI